MTGGPISNFNARTIPGGCQNRWPNQFALYDNGREQWWCGPDVAVSFDRPYGKYCQILDAPLSTGSGEWFLWEFPFAYWLESHGYDVTYISNLDTHCDPLGLRRAKGFLSVGHDEYYTSEMYQNLSRAIGQGLNVAFFAGNTCCGRIKDGSGEKSSRSRTFTRVDYFGPRDEGMMKRFPSMAPFPHTSPRRPSARRAEQYAALHRRGRLGEYAPRPLDLCGHGDEARRAYSRPDRLGIPMATCRYPWPGGGPQRDRPRMPLAGVEMAEFILPASTQAQRTISFSMLPLAGGPMV